MRGYRWVSKVYDFCLSKRKTKYMKYNFSKSCISYVGDRVISHVTRFKYFGFIVQKNREIEGDENYQIQIVWLKSRRTLKILCDTKIPLKLKRIFLYKNCKTSDIV